MWALFGPRDAQSAWSSKWIEALPNGSSQSKDFCNTFCAIPLFGLFLSVVLAVKPRGVARLKTACSALRPVWRLSQPSAVPMAWLFGGVFPGVRTARRTSDPMLFHLCRGGDERSEAYRAQSGEADVVANPGRCDGVLVACVRVDPDEKPLRRVDASRRARRIDEIHAQPLRWRQALQRQDKETVYESVSFY